MKEKNNHYQDLAYKFYFKTLRIKFHIYMGYDGEELKFTNTEINPLPNYEKRKDISYIIDGKTSYNIEFQSSAVYNDKMITIYKYHIYDETETGLPVKNIIFSTSNPNHGIKYIYIDYGIIFIPDFFFTKGVLAEIIEF